jgi:hypothetical protein
MCTKAQQVALPLLQQIQNKHLALSNYKLQDVHVAALAKAFEYEPQIITRFTLDNCGLSDRALATIFNGLGSL